MRLERQPIVVLSDIYATSNPNYFKLRDFLMGMAWDRVSIHRLR